MTKKLTDLKVLVSRLPQHAVEISKDITALGGQVIQQPLYTVESTVNDNLLQYLTKISGSTALAVFISRNSVDMIVPHLAEGFAGAWATTGPGTAQQLSNYGIRGVLHPTFKEANSTGLCNLLLEKKLELDGRRVVIFTGADFDSTLQYKLKGLNANVETIMVYKRCAPKNLQVDTTADVILITCVTSLINLQHAAPDLDLPIVAASDRIARAALEMGYSKVYTSISMQDIDLIDALGKVRDAKQRN